jgi:imidazolonepropionase-like amidohydrolase
LGLKIYSDNIQSDNEDKESGIITAVGKHGQVKIPKDARVIDCTGKTIVAGFWNSHVHLTEPAFNNAASAPAGAIEKHMQEMLTRWGFTTVWDLGSDPNNSLALRRRVESGEVPGPKILLAGVIFPKNGHPVYLPPEMQLPEAATPDEAAQMARDDLKMGLDGHEALYRRLHGQQASREHGHRHREGRGRCRARSRQASFRASPE